MAADDGRRRHPALRDGSYTVDVCDGPRMSVTFQKDSDRATLLINAGPTPWQTPVAVTDALDLLGGRVDPKGQAEVAPRDVALIIRNPQPDKTRY